MAKGYKIIDKVLIIDEGCTEIGSHEFFGLKINKVVIPEGVTKIGYWGFGGCKELEDIVLPSTLVSVANEAFAMCPLKNITFTNNCPQLKEVSLSSFSSYSPWAEAQRNGQDCCVVGSVLLSCGTQASSVVIPDGVQIIGTSAFSDCAKLTTVSFPDSVDTIADSAFCGCKKLKEVELPKALKALGSDVFYKCNGLKRITFPATLKVIGENDFKYSRQNETELAGLIPAMLNGCKINAKTSLWLLDNLWADEAHIKEIVVLFLTQSGTKVLDKAGALLGLYPHNAIKEMNAIANEYKLKASVRKKIDAFVEKYANVSDGTVEGSTKNPTKDDSGFITKANAKSFLAYYIVSKDFVDLFKQYSNAECLKLYAVNIDEANEQVSIIMPEFETNNDWYAASYVPECWGALNRSNAFSCLRAAILCNDDYIADETDLDTVLESCNIQDRESISLLKQLYRISLDDTQEKNRFSNSVKLLRVECNFKNSKESAIYEYNKTTGKETLTGKLWDYDYGRLKKLSVSEDIS